MAEDVYRRLQKHFDEFPYQRFPATESGVEISLLKRLFTSEEAEIATLMKCGYLGSKKDFESVEQIFERVKHLGFSIKDVEKHLDNMAKKGAIMGVTKDGINSYSNAILIVGIYEYQVNKLTKGFLDDFFQYLNEAWGPENSKVKTPQMRTIPVGIKIDHENPIAKYDDINVLFEESNGPFSIFNCICRQTKDIQGKPCQLTSRREVCMGFGVMAEMYNEQGWGREISKNEALEFLKENEQEGLIFQPGNSQEMDFVCSCCHCCCSGIASLRGIPNPADFTTSNYYAEINEKMCSGCGNCIERCQMDAITLENEISTINKKRCIGCGNCIIECPEDAISLIRKDKYKIPPLNVDELVEEISKEKRMIEKLN